MATEITKPEQSTTTGRGVSAVQRLVNWLWRKKQPQRKVMLVMYDNDMKIVKAYPTQSGWIARWVGNSDQWSLLLPDGKVEGTTIVKRWIPHSGWDGTEFDS